MCVFVGVCVCGVVRDGWGGEYIPEAGPQEFSTLRSLILVLANLHTQKDYFGKKYTTSHTHMCTHAQNTHTHVHTHKRALIVCAWYIGPPNTSAAPEHTKKMGASGSPIAMVTSSCTAQSGCTGVVFPPTHEGSLHS